MRLQVPAGWTRATALPAVPGLTLDGATGYTAPDGGAVMFGTVSEDADNSALLPAGLVQAAGGVPEQRTPVALGPDNLQAYRYSDVEVEGLDQPLTVYGRADQRGRRDRGVPAGQRELRGRGQHARADRGRAAARRAQRPVRQGGRGCAGRPVGRRRQGRRGATPREDATAQAAAARDLQAAYRGAAQALGEQQVNPADASANARLVAALAGVAKAYGQAASAAADGSKPRYQQAGKAVTAAQRDLDGALEGLRAAGYEMGS